MDPKKDFKKFFQKMFDTLVEMQGVVLTPEELSKKNFIIFVDNYKTATFRSQEITDKFGLDLWSWEDIFAKSLEGLINYSFTPETVEVILWYVYEHSLAEDEGDYVVTYGEDEYIIKNSDDLYKLVLLLEEE
jgi:hypothetical protein